MAFEHPLSKKSPIAAKAGEIQGKIGALEAELKALRQGAVETAKDYQFADAGGAVALSGLFGDKDELVLVHSMGTSCPYCTMWADGYSGVTSYVEERAAFVVASPDAPADQQKTAKSRGWNFRMVSSEGNSFFGDMGFEDGDGNPYPGVSTFRKRGDGSIEHLASAQFGPGDKFCSVFSFFDLLPEKETVAAE